MSRLDVPRWKIVPGIFLGDLIYLLAAAWLIRMFPTLIVAIVPLYLIGPGVLSIVFLSIAGFITFKNGGTRTLSLVLVCIILPEFAFLTVYAAAVLTCYYSWPMHCY